MLLCEPSCLVYEVCKKTKRKYWSSIFWEKHAPRRYRKWRWPDAYKLSNDEFNSPTSTVAFFVLTAGVCDHCCDGVPYSMVEYLHSEIMKNQSPAKERQIYQNCTLIISFLETETAMEVECSVPVAPYSVKLEKAV